MFYFLISYNWINMYMCMCRCMYMSVCMCIYVYACFVIPFLFNDFFQCNFKYIFAYLLYNLIVVYINMVIYVCMYVYVGVYMF